MSEISYCKSWFWPERCTNNPITEKEARKRHDKREEYNVVIGGFEHPTAIILLVRTLVAVSFPDALLREQLAYDFSEKEPGRLLLSMAVRREYCCPATPERVARMEAGRTHPDQPWAQFLADADRVLEGVSVSYETDGRTVWQYEHFADPYEYKKHEYITDVSGYWEPYPEFGHYEHLLKRDRGVEWGPGLDGP